MSSRKSSLRVDRTIDLLQLKTPNVELSRQRKNSTGIVRSTFDHIQNQTITLDEKLTTKLLLIKRLEKLEKEAIKNFYNNCHEECFNCLEKCLNIIEYPPQAGNGSEYYLPEHLVYIRYLQSQFKFKLRLFGEAREYYQKGCKIANKLNKSEREKSLEYLASLDALNANLQFEEGKFGDSIRHVEAIQQKVSQGTYKLNQKTIKQLSLCKIQSLFQLHRFSQTRSQIKKFQTVNKSLSNRQHYKSSTILATCLKNLSSISESEVVLEGLICFYKEQLPADQFQQNETNTEIHSYISKCYSFYVDFVEDDVLKAIYLCKRWRKDCVFQDIATAKLFRLYTQIADYQSALSQFAEIGDGYRRLSQDWECLAEIKEYYGENQTAQHMLNRALETTKNQQQKMKLQLKLLNFFSEGQRKQQLKSFEKKIKENRIKKWIEPIIQKYGQFLFTIGEQPRFQKITKLISFGSENYAKSNTSVPGGNAGNYCSGNQMMQTGKFGTFGTSGTSGTIVGAIGTSSVLKEQNFNVVESRVKKVLIKERAK